MTSIKLIHSIFNSEKLKCIVNLLKAREERRIEKIKKAIFVHKMLTSRFGYDEGVSKLNDTKWKLFLGRDSYVLYKKYQREQIRNLKRKHFTQKRIKTEESQNLKKRKNSSQKEIKTEETQHLKRKKLSPKKQKE